jgi:hypothetical protein
MRIDRQTRVTYLSKTRLNAPALPLFASHRPEFTKQCNRNNFGLH